MSELIDDIRKSSLGLLAGMLQSTLSTASTNLMGTQKDALGQEDCLKKIQQVFVENLEHYYDRLTGKVVDDESAMLYFELLALAQKRELEEMITVEGMIASARMLCSPNFVPFNQRLDTLLENTTIDENNNPMDPNQITSAFEESIEFLSLDPLNRLALFRDFNENLLKHMDKVLSRLNDVLISKGVLPELKAEYPKAASSAASAHHIHDPELFSTMQGLLHKDSDDNDTIEASDEALEAMVPTGSGIMQPVQFSLDSAKGEKKIEVLETSQLLEVLENIQKSLSGKPLDKDLFDPYLINEALGELLSRSQSKNTILAVDSNSSDVINLVTMLFAAIWQDQALPDSVKNLIGETQLTVTQLALTDTSFFSNEHHPARELINELANTASEWAQEDQLENLPIYQLMKKLVKQVTTGSADRTSSFDAALKELKKSILKEEKEKLKVLEEKIGEAEDRKECIEDIQLLVIKSINDRVAGRKIHRFFRESVENFFQKFLVLLVIKDGPRSNNWKQAFQTLDVLLWTLEFNKEVEDEKRIQTSNSGILKMLRKMFKVSKLEEDDIDTLIKSLVKAQNESLTPARYDVTTEQSGEKDTEETEDGDSLPSQPTGSAEDEPFLQQVDGFSVGTWVEITGLSAEPIRCKLAAKILPLDKYIFVNRDGVKVAETSREGLASDLKRGKVQIVSDGMLFSRALESVISNLQDSQDQQQGSVANL